MQVRRWLLTIGGLCLLGGCAARSPRATYVTHAENGSSVANVVSSQMEMPDLQRCANIEAISSLPPRRRRDGVPTEFWDIALTDVIRIGLEQSEVLRDLRGRVLEIPDGVTTVFDPAITMSHPRLGEEAALAVFDPQLTESILYTDSDRPFNNATLGGGAFEVQRDAVRWDWQLSKTAATGTQFGLRSFWEHDHNDSPANLFSHAWTNGIEASMRQPLLQGAGVSFNRIAGPLARADLSLTRGVILARIDGDISLADFERGVRDYVYQLEDAYWELYFAYRELDANRLARDSARQTWQLVSARYGAELRGGEADIEAQAREQMFLFEQQVALALEGSPDTTSAGGLYRRERQLRRLMGLPVNDGRLLRPSDEPTDARIEFDWNTCMADAMIRRVELRRQMWRVKQRELELIAARNFLLPRLDAVALYRTEGLGDDLMGSSDDFDGAVNELFSFEHYEAQAGLQLNVRLGYRAEMAGVQNAELQLRRARAVLADQEHAISHTLAESLAALSVSHTNIQLAYQRLLAAEDVVGARTATFQAGRGTIDALLEAQRRLADARTSYYRARTDHMLAIKEVHLQKGTLLAYDGVHLTEGSSDGAAQYRIQQRLARTGEHQLDYRFSQPAPVSRGVVPTALQHPADPGRPTNEARTAEKQSADPLRENGLPENGTPDVPQPSGAPRDELSSSESTRNTQSP